MSSNLDDFFEEPEEKKPPKQQPPTPKRVAKEKKKVASKPKKKEKRTAQKEKSKDTVEEKIVPLDLLLEEVSEEKEIQKAKDQDKVSNKSSESASLEASSRPVSLEDVGAQSVKEVKQKSLVKKEKEDRSPVGRLSETVAGREEAILATNRVSLDLIKRPKNHYMLSPLNVIDLIETIRTIPGYKNRLNYTINKVLPSNKEITPQELASLLSITIGEAALILRDARNQVS